ncbi:MAG: type III-B CRISPR module RAMP protein Cmr6 [Anaerolineales bacterium]
MSEKQEDGRRPVLRSVPYFPKSDQDDSTIPSGVHAGLWIDKYLPMQAKGLGELKAKHFAQTVRQVDALYKAFFDRWKKSLTEAGAQTHEAAVLGRLAIGLGGESVLETSISLHRTYGVPYIPGSALKGLAAHYAAKRLGDGWKPETEAYKIVFGNPKTAGYVTFYDALYVPGTDKFKTDTPLALDVMTVHHQDYYSGKDSPPADWDSPTPISFLSATGSYLIALGGPQEWVKAAFEILACALRDEGIGAKTSSGYGRMKMKEIGCKDTNISIASKPVETSAPNPLPSGYRRGTVQNFGLGDNKSYGYINVEGIDDIFVHRNDLANNLQTLEPGQTVVFHLVSEKGKPKAKDVRLDE